MRKYIVILLAFGLVACSSKKQQIVINKELFSQIQNKTQLNFVESEDYIVLTPQNSEHAKALKEEISHLAHKSGKCGGFSELTQEELNEIGPILKQQKLLNESFSEDSYLEPSFKEAIEKINKTLLPENIKSTIQFLVDQGTRSAKAKEPNKSIESFIKKINETLVNAKQKYEITRIPHASTDQDSIRVKLIGKTERVVVIGGHIDSIGGWFSKEAPGADDNASGSAVILEALRVFAHSDAELKHNMEFFWYAGEEQGLKGSKEIAQEYKNKNVDVVGVMQVDMVLYPGNGNIIGLTTDYTNKELTKFVEDLTTLYVGDSVERFACGYGCSDHAAWYQNGFKTVFPFESTFKTSNKNIHTAKDVIDSNSSIDHALKFAKLSVGFLYEMAEVTQTP